MTKRRRKSISRELKIRWFIGGGLIAAFALLIGLIFTFAWPQVREPELKLANPAPDMTLATLSGVFQLSENQGDILVLYFSFPG